MAINSKGLGQIAGGKAVSVREKRCQFVFSPPRSTPPSSRGKTVSVREKRCQFAGETVSVRIFAAPEHPAFIMDVIEAQQASIMAVQAGSPLAQLMQTPSSVGSHLQPAVIML
jgi:hypothetical protein